MCPYIGYAIGLASRYQSNLGKHHWEAVSHIKGTKDHVPVNGGGDLEIVGYIDADF